MATNASTTGASPHAPDFSHALHGFEAIQGECAVLRSLIHSASNEISTDGLSRAGINMVEAAGMIAELIMRNFEAAVDTGYAALKAGGNA